MRLQRLHAPRAQRHVAARVARVGHGVIIDALRRRPIRSGRFRSLADGHVRHVLDPLKRHHRLPRDELLANLVEPRAFVWVSVPAPRGELDQRPERVLRKLGP